VTVAPLATADGPDAGAVGTRTGELFAAHGRMVFAICRSILSDPHEAEDATQAAFLSAHEALVRGAAIRDPGAWLATIARNECRARLRGRPIEPLELHVENLADSVTTDEAAERRATVAHLRSAIASLPEKQRDAVVLRDLYGLRYVEICDALDVSRPSVEALLFRARRTLRVRLRPVGGAAIVVPLAVREGLAQAVPWFGQGAAGSVSAAAGAGILAQLGGSVAAKLAVGAVAVGVAGSAVGGDMRRIPHRPSRDPVVAQRPLLPTGSQAGHEATVGLPSGTRLPATPVDGRVEPAAASRRTPEPVRPARPSSPVEGQVSRPVTSRVDTSPAAHRTRVAAPRLARQAEPAPAPTTTRTDPAPPVRAAQPTATVPRTGRDPTVTTETRVEPVTTTPVRTDTQTTPAR
jgi:RNA polymerase sigma factor (sigma-70 family)